MKSIGNYILLYPMGSGSFSTVYAAEHVILKVQVAIKEILYDEAFKKCHSIVCSEVKALRELDHANICHLFEVIETNSAAYIVLEKLEYGTLCNFISLDASANEDIARKYYIQLIKAVSYTHKKGFLHRDIKAENVLVDRNLNTRLIDYGFSVNNLDFVDTKISGSFAYLAPEILEKIHYSTASDIYSTGVLLFLMIFGYLPFDDNSLDKLKSKIIYAEPIIPNTVSHELQDLLMKLLCKDPYERITVPAILKHPWIRQTSAMDIIGNISEGELTSSLSADLSYHLKKRDHIINQLIEKGISKLEILKNMGDCENSPIIGMYNILKFMDESDQKETNIPMPADSRLSKCVNVRSFLKVVSQKRRNKAFIKKPKVCFSNRFIMNANL